MKTFEQYSNRNKFKYGDYIIVNMSFRSYEKGYYILFVHNTPGPEGHKIDYYSLHILKQFNPFDKNTLDWVDDNSTITINKEQLESNCLYTTDTLEDAEKKMYIIKNVDDFNI